MTAPPVHQKIGCAVQVRTVDFLATEMVVAEAELQGLECAEKIRLVSHYQVATADYNRAVQVLAKRSGTMQKAHYLKIRAYAETARLHSEIARQELDRHTAEHGC